VETSQKQADRRFQVSSGTTFTLTLALSLRGRGEITFDKMHEGLAGRSNGKSEI
jgi:hypothetical protein